MTSYPPSNNRHRLECDQVHLKEKKKTYLNIKQQKTEIKYLSKFTFLEIEHKILKVKKYSDSDLILIIFIKSII